MTNILDFIIIGASGDDRKHYDNYLKSLNLDFYFIEDEKHFIKLVESLKNDTRFRVWIHLGAGELKKPPFPAATLPKYLKEYYPNIQCHIVTREPQYVNDTTEGIRVYSMHGLTRNDVTKFPVNLRSKLNKIGKKSVNGFNSESEQKDTAADVAIITALHDNELECINHVFELHQDTSADLVKVIHFGNIENKDKRNIKIVAACQPEYGMVDAAILTTEIIAKYKPQYAIMSGVCGGSPDNGAIKIGDIIIPQKVFSFQKGKFKGSDFQPEIASCDIEEKLIQMINIEKRHICNKIMENNPGHSENYRKSPLEIHILPMACSTYVMDAPGMFKEQILTKDRKTSAVDMESYAVARACAISNNKSTKAIVIKSVMDKTIDKADSAKSQAALVSALCARFIITDVLQFDTR